MDWTKIVWRVLCGLATMSGFMALCGLLPTSPVLLTLSVAPGLLVTLILVCAQSESHTRSATSSASLIERCADES